MVQKITFFFILLFFSISILGNQADLNRFRIRLSGLSQRMIKPKEAAKLEVPKNAVQEKPEAPKSFLDEIKQKKELKHVDVQAPREFDLVDELHKQAGEKKSILGLVDAVKTEDKQVKELVETVDAKLKCAAPLSQPEKEFIEKEAAVKKAELEKAKEYALTLDANKVIENIRSLDSKLEAQIKSIQEIKACKNHEKLNTILEHWPLQKLKGFSSTQDLQDITEIDIEPIKVQLTKILDCKNVLVKTLKSAFSKHTKDELTQSLADIQEAKTALSAVFNGIEQYSKSREFREAEALLLTRTQGKQPSAINYKILPKVLPHFFILIDASLCMHKDLQDVLQGLLAKIKNFERVRVKLSEEIEKDTIDTLIRDYMLCSCSQKNEHLYGILLKNVPADRWHAIKALREKYLKELFKLLELYAHNHFKDAFEHAVKEYKVIDERYKKLEKECATKIEQARDLCEKELKALDIERSAIRIKLQGTLVRETASQELLTEKIKQAQKFFEDTIKQASLPEFSKQLWSSSIARYVGDILKSYNKLDRIQLYETVLPPVIEVQDIFQTMRNRLQTFTPVLPIKKNNSPEHDDDQDNKWN